MHELTICESLFKMVEQEQQTRHFTKVCRVRLEIGRFSCLDPEALRYAFDILGRETMLEGAKLEIDQPPGDAICLDCGAAVAVDTRLSDCPACGGKRLRPTGGDQMRFIEMEVR
ncbi:MAG: hydrogenase maturation nickel metallochaperone HypA [Acetobacteraceae bacterium]|nr:hydrogenase maturation nickel metallochaperone HypA [Acetobacteraceae bacterium]